MKTITEILKEDEINRPVWNCPKCGGWKIDWKTNGGRCFDCGKDVSPKSIFFNKETEQL